MQRVNTDKNKNKSFFNISDDYVAIIRNVKKKVKKIEGNTDLRCLK